jgi:hypothetical protein
MPPHPTGRGPRILKNSVENLRSVEELRSVEDLNVFSSLSSDDLRDSPVSGLMTLNILQSVVAV